MKAQLENRAAATPHPRELHSHLGVMHDAGMDGEVFFHWAVQGGAGRGGAISQQGGAGWERGLNLRGRAGPGLSRGREHTAYIS